MSTSASFPHLRPHIFPQLTPPQTNPSQAETKPEPTGPVPQESLAAESLRSGGSFAENVDISGVTEPASTPTARARPGLESSKYAGEVTAGASGHGEGEGGGGAKKGWGSKAEKMKAEDVDWSQISTDTRTTTNIGSEEDPGRMGELHMKKKMNTHGGGGPGDADNMYQTLGGDEMI
jgi:hypothetical protein